MNKQILIVLKVILAMCILSSCKPNLYDKIESHIKKNCEDKDTCILFLKDITDFEWEQFYYIPNGFYASEVLGFDYPFNTDLSEVLVFLREGKIVYHEEVFQPVSEPSRYTFTIPGIEKYYGHEYLLLSSNEAVFQITKWNWEKDGKTYYLLYPVDRAKW